MSDSKKIRIGWLAFAFVVCHVGAIVVFAFPESLMSSKLKTASSYYVHPIFDQTWSLFAPAPTLNSHLEVKYTFDDDTNQTEWLYPLKKDFEKHQLFRMSHHGELAVGQSNLLFFLANDLSYLGISIYDDFPDDSLSAMYETSSYWMVQKFVYGLAKYKFDKYPTTAEVHCFYQNVETKESGSFILPMYKFKKPENE